MSKLITGRVLSGFGGGAFYCFVVFCLVAARLSAQSSDGRFTTHQPIVIDGSFVDWTPILMDPDNNSKDGGQPKQAPPVEPQPDRDAPVQSTGRDMIHFTYTWDDTHVQAYTGRVASATNVQNFIYYADLDNDGLMETGERVVAVNWKGNNRNVELYLGTYVESSPGGDSMVDGAGYADGYTLPGTVPDLPSSPDYSGTWGGTSGVVMEWEVPWADSPGAPGLGIPPGSAFSFHTSSSNSQPGTGSFPEQIDDNMAGDDGGAGSNQYADMTFVPDRTLQGEESTTVYGAHTLTNDGNGSDTFDFTSSMAGDHTPGLTYYLDADASGTFTAGDTALTDTDGDGDIDTGAVARDETVYLLFGYAIGSPASGVATIETTAASSYRPATTRLVTDTVTVVVAGTSDLGTSTKAVVDLNGGEADPGDVLRYTVTVNETAGNNAQNLTVTDDIPAKVTGFTVISTPPGAADNSTFGGTGANGTGYLNVTGFNVPPNSSRTIVFEVTITGSAMPGDIIANTALIIDPGGPGAIAVGPDVVVSPSGVPSSGTKPLYVTEAARMYLRRLPSPSIVPIYINGNGANLTWTMSPLSSYPITLASGSHPVRLWILRDKKGTSRTVTVTLASTGATTGPIGSPVTQTFNIGSGSAGQTEIIFNVSLASQMTLSAGSAITLTVQNDTAASKETIGVIPAGITGSSRVMLNSFSVIDINSIEFYDAAYPGGSVINPFSMPGDTLYVRSVLSDPFGSYDIHQASVTITDPLGTTMVSDAAMSEVYDSGAGTKTFEYVYVIPGAGEQGYWDAEVTTVEGIENLVQDTATDSVLVAGPDLMVLKSLQTIYDPVNETTNPKAIPGGRVMYTVQITNTGLGTADSDSVVISDPIDPNAGLFVGDMGGAGSGPVAFSDGATASGLSFTFTSLASTTDDVDFSNDGGTSFTYVPVPDGDDFDDSVNALRINPKGTLSGATGGGDPSFQVTFVVRVK